MQCTCSFLVLFVFNLKIFNRSSGNIRVYCRIRPAFHVEATKVIDFIGEDGSLVVLDPLKSQKDGKRVFRFDHIFGPTATQGKTFCKIYSFLLFDTNRKSKKEFNLFIVWNIFPFSCLR